MLDAIYAALIGAGVAGLGSFVSYAVMAAKHEARLDEHDKRFVGVDKVFEGLDSRFVPRNEINVQLETIKTTSTRIEATLNLLSPWFGRPSSHDKAGHDGGR